MLIFQLSIKEIDQIISYLQEPYPIELIKRLEQLKNETQWHIDLDNSSLIQRMAEERQINEHGFGTAPIYNAYIEIRND